MTQRLKGKNIVVTGGTKGIGKTVVEIVMKEGANVVFGGRNTSEGESIVTELNSKYESEVHFIAGDIAQVEACQELIETAIQRFGRLDGLVNNAGYFPRATILDTEEELYEQVFDINAKSAFFCSKFAIQAMMITGGGSIVQMGSTHGYGGCDDLAAYGIAKGAMLTLNKHIAKNFAQHHIRSNWITVGWVATDGEVARVEQEGQSIVDLEKGGNMYIPTGRLQTEEDMAYGVVYLLSDESAQVIGTELHITGGFNLPI